MLRSEAFNKLPQEKVARLMLKMEPLTVKPGEVIIKQGDPGDYYYVVKEGRFNVSRKDLRGKVKILAEMHEGSVFGEEALISGEARNTSVIAMTEGILMRLAKQDFDELLKEPLLTFVSSEKAREMVKRGARWLDVRARDEFEMGALRDSVNIPLRELRDMIGKLDRTRRYVVCCKIGVQSEVAAFLLSQCGFDVCVLHRGLQGILKRR